MFFLIRWGKALSFAIGCFWLATLAGCDGREVASGKPEVFCSIAPLGAYASQIGGDLIAVKVVIPPGRSVHEFSPTPAEVRALQKAKMYFITGLPVEKNLLTSLRNAHVKVINIAAEIPKLTIAETGGHTCEHEAEEGHVPDADLLDQHIWLSPTLSIRIVEEMTNALVAEFPEAKEQLEQRSATLKAELTDVQTRISQSLAPLKGKSFLVYHPAFGYFAHDFDLHQVAVEHDGKAPTARQLTELAKWVRSEKIHILFSQVETNKDVVNNVGKALDCRVVELDVLSSHPIAFFLEFSNALQEANTL